MRAYPAGKRQGYGKPDRSAQAACRFFRQGRITVTPENAPFRKRPENAAWPDDRFDPGFSSRFLPVSASPARIFIRPRQAQGGTLAGKSAFPFAGPGGKPFPMTEAVTGHVSQPYRIRTVKTACVFGIRGTRKRIIEKQAAVPAAFFFAACVFPFHSCLHLCFRRRLPERAIQCRAGYWRQYRILPIGGNLATQCGRNPVFCLTFACRDFPEIPIYGIKTAFCVRQREREKTPLPLERVDFRLPRKTVFPENAHPFDFARRTHRFGNVFFGKSRLNSLDST